MFSLTVRRNFMIAHSLPRPAFGPAQGMHGATFVTEVTFRRRALNGDSIVVDIGEAGTVLDSILDGLNYKNLDEHPDFAGRLSTTEALAQYIADAVAARICTGADGRELAGLDVTLRETPDAWASYTLDFEAGPDAGDDRKQGAA
ncbi:6-carboxytetrahydropterin synthase [Pseudarthrobacter sp. PH31-O2]|uniref:6-pyruvoyl trahydropterin synthase family protein n=1 Tax=Micrococcaceae TaxID=1268 RepID=UPI0024B8EC14|nr:6-carboxytetrahydropterin synthase [Pseudarthrobacter sp. PH31-O2]MDJ0353073.1 6-carboxytetrahydropterin synthase [Pseudarthrobacter sp. PH31-O2]